MNRVPALRFHHVGIAVGSLTRHLDRFRALLGAALDRGGTDRKLDAEWRWLSLPDGAVIELIAPLGMPEGPIRRYLDRRGEGLHHISFDAPDLDGAMEHVRALGEEPQWIDRDHGGYEEFFLDPARFGGVLVHAFRELGS
jgi:methylmalonyl-CoA/ethylmalonyl-CoA epimerase